MFYKITKNGTDSTYVTGDMIDALSEVDKQVAEMRLAYPNLPLKQKHTLHDVDKETRVEVYQWNTLYQEVFVIEEWRC